MEGIIDLIGLILDALKFLFRIIIYFVVEILFEIIAYKLGTYFIKIITFGSYSKGNDNKLPIAFLGIAILVIIIVLFFMIKL